MIYKTTEQVILDECFQFGLGAFETIAIEDGIPIFLEKHLRRLERAAQFLHLGTLSERGVTREAVFQTWKNQQCQTLVHGQATDEQLQRGALKIMLSKENVIFSMRTNPYTPERYEKGFVMDISNVRRNETSPLVYHKTMNYGDCILEKRNASAAGMDERLFLNTKGQICEGTVSNVFFVKKGRIYTPRVTCGLLPGILREYICETEDVEETDIYLEDLESYEECFVTNSLMGIMSVRKIQNITFESRNVSEKKIQDIMFESRNISEKLMQAYRNR